MRPYTGYEVLVSLKQKLLAWMRGGDGCFEEAALEVYRYQFGSNLAYRNYSEALGRTPENVTAWREIPAVPADVFKLPGGSMRCFPSFTNGEMQRLIKDPRGRRSGWWMCFPETPRPQARSDIWK